MAAKEEVSKKRTRRSKAEIEQEFNLVVQQETEALDSSTPKARELMHLQQQEVINSVKDISSDEIIRKFADLNIEITKTFSTLSEKIVLEIQFLAKLRSAVELEKQEIERLHKIDIAQTALDQLIEEYQVKKAQFETDMSAEKERCERERTTHLAKEEEEMEILTKRRKREDEEYEYKKNLDRKKAHDKYEEETRLRDKQNKEKQEALEKNWLLREESLKNQENELQHLRQQVIGYPEHLEKEIQKAVIEAIKRTELKQSHEIELLKRDNESERRIAELKIKTLEETLSRQLAAASNMQGQVEEAKKQVQDIAVKAIEGASGAKAFQIALEQSKGRSVGI